MNQSSHELVAAVYARDPVAVAAALGSGASVDARDTEGKTALMSAAVSGDAEIVRALLEAGASPNRRTVDREETVLHLLARANASGPVLDAIVAAKTRVDRRDRFGWTPLMVAAQNGAAEVLRALLAAGADAALTTPDGKSARDLAAEAGQEALLEDLV